MFSFLIKSKNAWDFLTPGTVDKNPVQHTVHNSVEEKAKPRKKKPAQAQRRLAKAK